MIVEAGDLVISQVEQKLSVGTLIFLEVEHKLSVGTLIFSQVELQLSVGTLIILQLLWTWFFWALEDELNVKNSWFQCSIIDSLYWEWNHFRDTVMVYMGLVLFVCLSRWGGHSAYVCVCMYVHSKQQKGVFLRDFLGDWAQQEVSTKTRPSRLRGGDAWQTMG